MLATLAQKYPVTMTEIGQIGCTHEYVDDLMAWADSHGIGYLAFTWNWKTSPRAVVIGPRVGVP